MKLCADRHLMHRFVFSMQRHKNQISGYEIWTGDFNFKYSNDARQANVK